MKLRPQEAAVVGAVAAAVDGRKRLMLAVSGGLDSMVLLDAVADCFSPLSSVIVATFDHATGPHSAQAVDLVRRQAMAAGMRFTTGKARIRGRTEREWRQARWAFLRAESARFDATVTTAHTQDDQVETVFIRVLRDAGPRGLSGLYAESPILRPLLELSRADIEAYASARNIDYVEDPSNTSRQHLRNRVRHDLLPAIARSKPDFASSLLETARHAASWRRALDEIVDGMQILVIKGRSLRIARSVLAGYDADALCALWPAIAARAGVVMDRRGTHRLAEFTMNGHNGGSVQLSGGIEVRMFRDYLSMRRWDVSRVEIRRSARRSLPREFSSSAGVNA